MVRGTVAEVEGDVIRLRITGSINGKEFEYSKDISLDELTPDTLSTLLGEFAPENPAQWMAKAVRAVATRDLERAEETLAKAPDHPLRAFYRERVRDERKGAAEAGAERFWETRIVPVLALATTDAKAARTLDALFREFGRAHSATTFFKGIEARVTFFNPMDFAPVADSLDCRDGTLTFETETGVVRSSTGGEIGTGVVDAANRSGKVVMAAFCFGSISIGPEVTVEVVGNRGLALLSRGRFEFGGVVDVSGKSGDEGGRGGPGAEGGGVTVKPGRRSVTRACRSNPPGETRPNKQGDGHGYGGGIHGERTRSMFGGGGSYGGEGGLCAGRGGAASPPYGDELLVDVYGGSGGGRWHAYFDPQVVLGGGGGGATMFVSMNEMSISGRILARGGKGGDRKGGGRILLVGSGGSGGGILLAAPSIRVDGAATISARGGDGPSSGGGGRVAIYARAPIGNPRVEVGPGKGERRGGDGTFRHFGDDGEGELTFLLAPRGATGARAPAR